MTKRLLAGILTSLLSFVTGVTISLANSACGIGDGTVIDGGRGYHFIACKSGSILIVRSTEAYPTAKKANRVFEDRLQKATTVIQRNQKIASKGKTIGQRAVATFADMQTGKPFTSVFWVDERFIVSIDSTSHYCALFAEWWSE